MNHIRKAITTLGGIFLAALLIAALAPKATRGIVAAFVQVTNTTANPASTLDADKATRIPYQEVQYFTGSPGFPSFVGFNLPPAGYRLVVENVNVLLVLNSGAASMPTGVLISQYGNLAFAGNITEHIYVGTQSGVINQPVTTYSDSTDPSGPSVEVNADFYAGQMQSVTLTGHLINCAVVGCPAVH